MKTKQVQVLVQDVPESLRRDFKTACVHKGTTMKAEIVKFMAGYVRKFATK
jgi:hypothetical protein